MFLYTTSYVLTPNIREIAKWISTVQNPETGQPCEVRVAGGAVRDMLLGIQSSDIDLATDMLPETMMDLFKDKYTTIDAGLKHGTVAVMVNGEKIEITTLRVDKVCDGRHAEVEFTHDWKADAQRRDFTINAMFLDMDSKLHDYFGGEDDLANKLVRFVGDADARIQEDYLRILRFFRFNGKLGVRRDSYDADSLAAIGRNALGLHQISGERIWMEMQKIIALPTSYGALQTMSFAGVLYAVGLPVGFDIERLHNVRLYTGNPITLLATGLAGDQLAAEVVSERWKLSGAENKLLSFVVEHDTDEFYFAIKNLRMYKGMVVELCHNRCPVDEAKFMVSQLGYSFGDAVSVKEALTDWEVPVFPVNGKDLQEIGLLPGPDFGRILKTLHNEWKRSEYQATKKDLVALVSNMI